MDQRRSDPVCGWCKSVQLRDLASGCNLEPIAGNSEGLPFQTLQINQSPQLRLWFREEPGAASQPCVSVAPFDRVKPILPRRPDLFDGQQIHSKASGVHVPQTSRPFGYVWLSTF